MNATDHVASLGKGLAVLSFLASSLRPQSLSDVASALDMPRATARRFLLTLVELGYAETDQKYFRVSAKVLELGYGYFTANPLTEHINAELEKIVEETGQTSFASIYNSGEIVLIGRKIGRFVETSRILGSRLPAYCTSMGRVFLSALDDATVAGILKESKPKAITPQTKTSKRDILQALDEVRRLGYAVAENETTLGLRAIAVPVRRSDGEIVAAIDVVMIASSEDLETSVSRLVPVLKASAQRLGDIASHFRAPASPSH